MIFKQISELLAGSKTQTRRVRKEDEGSYSLRDDENNIIYTKVFTKTVDGTRTKWAVGRTYAIVPKRGAKGIGQRIRITAIRLERLGDISEADARAEGVKSVGAYKALWVSINGHWDAECEVWVISFEVVQS